MTSVAGRRATAKSGRAAGVSCATAQSATSAATSQSVWRESTSRTKKAWAVTTSSREVSGKKPTNFTTSPGVGVGCVYSSACVAASYSATVLNRPTAYTEPSCAKASPESVSWSWRVCHVQVQV